MKKKHAIISLILALCLTLGFTINAMAYDKKHLEQFKKTGFCRNCDLKGANLQGMEFFDIDLQGTNLQGANLQGREIYNANMKGVNLDGANLSGADLDSTRMDGATLRGANLSGAYLHATGGSGVDFTGANLRNAEFTYTSFRNPKLEGVDFTGTQLNHTLLFKLYFGFNMYHDYTCKTANCLEDMY